tara:strand:- start:127 stop:828 length:702 start_codon:yes stop_codon:yes gene_type:complete
MSPNELSSVEATPLLIGLLGYILYFLFLKSSKLKSSFSKLLPVSKASFYWVQLSRVIAFVCMANMPIAYINYFDIDFWTIRFIWTNTDTISTIVLALILVPLGAINAKGNEHLNVYPEVRMKEWNAIEYFSNILSWGIYLLAYEFLFRGVLFLGMLLFIDLYPAIILNTLLYALAHLHKGKKETLGSIPLGIVLCFITFKTQTIWTAFAVHWIMATTNFVFSHYYTSKTSTNI